MSDEENDLETSDYFSESTPKSCKSIQLDHKYALSPQYSPNQSFDFSSISSTTSSIPSLTPSSITSSTTCLTPKNSKRNLVKNQKLVKRRKLFGRDSEELATKSAFVSKVTPLSERQQLAIALQLSSNASEYASNHSNETLIQTNNALKCGQRVRRNHKGETALHIAAIKGDLIRVKEIIAKKSHHIDITDFAGWSAIHEACNRGFTHIVEELLKGGSDVNARGYNNDTPLIDAAVNGHYLLVDLLLRYGADYTLTNNSNKSALEVTKSVRVVEVIDSFISEKMRKNGGNTKDIVNTFVTKSRSTSPSSSSCPLKPSSPRLTLRFQTIKDCKQTTAVTITSNTSSPTMASTKTYSVSTPLDKEVINESNNEKQIESKTVAPNGNTSDSVTASSDHTYTSVDSTQTAAADDSSRGRKRRKSTDGSVSSTSATSGASPRSGSTSSVGSSTQSSSWHNKKHHHQHQHPHHPHHHHVNHSNKSSNSKDKSVKKLFSSSSDSEGIEGSECDKEPNLKDNPSNTNSSNNSNEANAPKVPPLRIVLPANTSSSSTSALIATTAANSSLVSSSVTSSTSVSGAKFPYVVSSEETFQSESECNSGAVGSQRITRSSQRVAQQQQSQKSASNEHHSDSEESALVTDSQHPRKRKIRNNNTNETKSNTNANNTNNSVNTNPNSSSNGDNDNDSTSSTSSVNGLVPKDVSPFALPQTNCYQMFLSIRKNVDKKRKEMFSVPPKAPQGFDHYLLNRCSYILEGKPETSMSKSANTGNGGATGLGKPCLSVPPNTLSDSRMRDMFCEQDRHRHKLRVQHLIEREKLVLSAEQEILRVHGRAARATANQPVPFSVCSILKDEEIYNILDSESDQNDNISHQLKTDKPLATGTTGLSANRTRYNGRLFLSWIQDVIDKWEKIKEVMLLRHRKESESLLAMQRLEWEWKLKEFSLCDLKANPNIDDKHVPKVEVNEEFELFPV